MTDLTPERIRQLLPVASIRLDATATDRDDAIRRAGALLVASGAVDTTYAAAMIDRETLVSTYVGAGIAFPHGTAAVKSKVSTDALALMRFAEPIDWAGESVSVVIAIAARGRGYIALLSQLASTLLDDDRASALREATTADEVYGILAG